MVSTAAADSLKKHSEVTLQVISKLISKFLDKRKVKTARGGKWYPASVKNLLEKIYRDLSSSA